MRYLSAPATGAYSSKHRGYAQQLRWLRAVASAILVPRETGAPPQMTATPSMPERQAVGLYRARASNISHALSPTAQTVVRDMVAGIHVNRARVNETVKLECPVPYRTPTGSILATGFSAGPCATRRDDPIT
jgi:hypothetical protein